jgi:AcrR family transcriptional regulator
MTLQVETTERLPRGPHGLTREQVQASQRQRILDAALDVVGERGYAATTVADITSAAGVSRTTFYEQFQNKLDAFLTAYDEFGKAFLADVAGTPRRRRPTPSPPPANDWSTGGAGGPSPAALSCSRSTPSASKDSSTATA